jgi:outer membrane protein OmpA-like peptidoglycan-associated protein
MTLRWTFKDVVIQVIRIDRPAPADEGPAAQVAAALASQACRAELHGIYFDTGSATLLAPSAATIAEVAAMLQREPDWRVTIEGHTDAIGSDADNQALSQARAEAVRSALVDGHGIDAARLTAAGLGETRPVESNDTVEGRAHNRRVELSRECP